MMARFRNALFWIHLTAGVLAGVVILLMCVTGVVLTYEKQMLEWADRRSASVTPTAAVPLPPAALLRAAMRAVPDAAPTAITLRADRRAPATVSFDGRTAALVDPYSAAVLGEPSPGLRRFFRTMTDWHRWLAREGTSRATGRAVTGAANLAFLFVVLSGMYLWLPKVLTWIQLKQVLWFRRGLPPKARDFNWHNVVGIWSAVPLAIVVAGAVPISYGWAGALVYRLAGEKPPIPAPAAGARSSPGGPAGRPAQTDAPRLPDLTGLDRAWATAQQEVPEWRAASLRLVANVEAPSYVVTMDAGYGGQPQHRTTLTIDRADATVARRERFDDLSPGRQWRSWFRFVHTGEYYGLPGQTVAGVVSAGGAVLVCTGIALSWRRFRAWSRRRTSAAEVRPAA
jgi:uncharacterized iron-regulated membrane protein